MKKLLLVIFFCFAADAAYAEIGDRHIEQAGSFSLRAPHGWQFRDFPGMKYQIASGPAANAFSPNINIVDEAYSGPLKSYVDENVKSLKKVFVQFTLVKREAFVTTSGVKGERMITTSLQQKSLLRQTFYFFPGARGKYLVVTCSALAEGGAALDSVFEESLRTFEITK